MKNSLNSFATSLSSVLKVAKITIDKSELESIRQSQEFLSTKFDELAASTNQLKDEDKELRIANTQLQNQVVSLEKQHISLDTETENMKCYLRRDLLEIM